MNWYITRVELKNANWQDYEKLHEAMAEEGFDKTITGGTGVEYHLIDGEYFYENANDLKSRDVLNKAEVAIQKTKKNFRVFVTKADSMSWKNLDQV
jgi:hypothetical protein